MSNTVLPGQNTLRSKIASYPEYFSILQYNSIQIRHLASPTEEH